MLNTTHWRFCQPFFWTPYWISFFPTPTLRLGRNPARYTMANMSEPAAVLNLWKKDLGRVPDFVWQRTELEALILADNGLTEISEQLGRLSRLRMLDLGHNQ